MTGYCDKLGQPAVTSPASFLTRSALRLEAPQAAFGEFRSAYGRRQCPYVLLDGIGQVRQPENLSQASGSDAEFSGQLSPAQLRLTRQPLAALVSSRLSRR